MKVACLSNLSLGYGTPQIVYLVRSLSEYFDSPDRPFVIENDQIERPPRHDLFADLAITRIHTQQHPYSRHGAIQYIRRAASLLNDVRPDVLLLPSTYCLPVLWKLSYQPRLVIYYILEMPDAFGFTREEHALNKFAREKVHLAIYPEPNRARIHIDEFKYHRVPSVIVYNAIPYNDEAPLLADQRNGRILYQGTIHDTLTSGDFFLDDDVQKLPIDLYGIVDSKDEEFKRAISGCDGNVKYKGYIDNTALRAQRRAYHYSIVYWNPINDNQRFACPNKYFESVADGVPPITAPHPQAKLLTERYECGLVMDDWGLDCFTRALQRSLELIGSPEYDRMVENCRAAYREELNWEAQFDKVRRRLDAMNLLPRRTTVAV